LDLGLNGWIASGLCGFRSDLDWLDWNIPDPVHRLHWLPVRQRVMSTPIIRSPTAVPANRQHSVRRPCVQLNCTSYLEQFTNYLSNSIHYQHFSTTPQDSSFLRQHRHRLTVTIRAYDSNFCFDIWRVTNADYLLTYLLIDGLITALCRNFRRSYSRRSLKWLQ